MSLIVIDAKKLKWKHSGKLRKHTLKISSRFIAIDIYLSGLLARRQNAWSQDGGNMRVIANGVNR